MRVINARNVNDAYVQGLELLNQIGIPETTRAGRAIVSPLPVTTVYSHPRERVLFCAKRDANPFFHFFESLWMLSGRNDARWLDQFVGNFSSRFAEDDGIQHGAYGYRWRRHFMFDQLRLVIHRMREDPSDRRVVISMWDPMTDLLETHVDQPRDLPCNTHIYPRIRSSALGSYLDITVCCRSNDAIWGAYGANAVHFSFLQEYLAGMIGVGVGRMYQVSNNFHVYTSVLEEKVGITIPDASDAYTSTSQISPTPIGVVWSSWDEDLGRFMADPRGTEYSNEFFSRTALPMYLAYSLWRSGSRTDALDMCNVIGARDWWLAAHSWMMRRGGSQA